MEQSAAVFKFVNTVFFYLFQDGLGYKDLLSMCLRYQEHLSECSNIVAMEQAREFTHYCLLKLKHVRELLVYLNHCLLK